MCKCMMEINLIFDETSIQVENCNLIPDECRDKICVLKIEGQTFVLIELEQGGTNESLADLPEICSFFSKY